MAGTHQNPSVNLYVTQLNVNAPTITLETVIQKHNITKTEISNSEIHKLTIQSAENLVNDGSVDVGAVGNNEGPYSTASPKKTFDSQDWTKLSDTVSMFNKTTLRPHARVYQGKQRHFSGRVREVVVKLLKKTENCAREVDILLKLADHQNIVKILESGKCCGTVPEIFIVMELCHKNLTEYITEKPFDLDTAVSFFRQTTSAIVFIHDNNIAHRDLKPRNILVTKNGKDIKVTDFGISREIPDEQTRVDVTNPGAGTEGFKAPETYLGEAEVGFKVDIFSLGICGCIILTHGRHPFGPDPHLWTANIVNNTNCDLSGIPIFPERICHRRAHLIELLRSMMKPNPSDRPSARQVHDDMFFNECSSKLLHTTKFFDPSMLCKRPDPQGLDKMYASLEIVESEIRKNTNKVQESIQILKESCPESLSPKDIVEMSEKFAEKGRFICVIILLRFANEMQHLMQDLSSEGTVTWICDILVGVANASGSLIKCNDESRDIGISYGMRYMEQLLDELRAVANVSDEVRALKEACCLGWLSLVHDDADDYENAIRFGEEGAARLEKQFGENAKEHQCYSGMLNSIGIAHGRLGRYEDAERYFVKAIEATDEASYADKQELSDMIKSNLNFVFRQQIMTHSHQRGNH